MTTHDTTGANGVETRSAETQTAGPSRSRVRKACDQEAAEIVAELLRARRESGDRSTSDATLADRLDLKSTTSVVALRQGDQPWHLGDLIALPRTLAMDIITALTARIERGAVTQSADLRDHALAVSEAEGDLSRSVRRAFADGVVDDEERRAISLQAIRLTDKAFDAYLAASPATARRGAK